MSKSVDINNLTDDEKSMIDTQLYKKIEKERPNPKFKKYNQQSEYIQLYDYIDNMVYVPFNYNSISKLARRPKTEFDTISYKFTSTLRPLQQTVKDTTLTTLSKQGCFIISAGTGFGKTITSIYVLTCIGMKTLIVVNRVMLLSQWKEEIEQFVLDPRVKILDPKKKTDGLINDYDIFIVNAINIPKFGKNFMSNFGFIIVDEIHQILTKVLSKCMFCLSPRYLLGLSATPYRSDGLNFLFDLYFGTEKAHIPLNQKHIVYKINTNLTPEVEYDVDGSSIWDSVLSFQAKNTMRNEIIIKIIKHFRDNTILVLTKRIEHAKYLINRLIEEKENVTSLIQSEKTFDKDSRIIVGSASKVGTGFSHKKINMLIIASDIVEYFVQYLGRAFRDPSTVPIIIDLVDNNKTLERHFSMRKKVYKDCGGEFRDLHKDHNIDLSL